MSNRSKSPLSTVRVTAASLIIGLVLSWTANASAGTGFAFVDSIASFFGFATETKVASTSAPDDERMLVIGVCDTAGPIEVESSAGTLAGIPTAYASLTVAGGAFAAINGGVAHLGVINIEICGNSVAETGVTALNQVAGVTSIAINPVGGVDTNDLLAQPLPRLLILTVPTM